MAINLLWNGIGEVGVTELEIIGRCRREKRNSGRLSFKVEFGGEWWDDGTRYLFDASQEWRRPCCRRRRATIWLRSSWTRHKKRKRETARKKKKEKDPSCSPGKVFASMAAWVSGTGAQYKNPSSHPPSSWSVRGECDDERRLLLPPDSTLSDDSSSATNKCNRKKRSRVSSVSCVPVRVCFLSSRTYSLYLEKERERENK